jgi:hypothetical protein
MTETSEEAGGFDRRSLIKKGLVIGGAATVLPVISTFNAPAFAASPGVFVIVFDAAGANGGVARNPSYSIAANLTSCNRAFAASDNASVDIVVTVTGLLGDKYDFTFGPGDNNCTFTGAEVLTDRLLPLFDPIVTDCSGPPSTVSPTLVQLDRQVAILENRHLFLYVTCT